MDWNTSVPDSIAGATNRNDARTSMVIQNFVMGCFLL
jgi:hypothetical protein